MPITHGLPFAEVTWGGAVQSLLGDTKIINSISYGRFGVPGLVHCAEKIRQIRLESSFRSSESSFRSSGLAIQSGCLSQRHCYRLPRVTCELEGRGSESLGELGLGGSFAQRLSLPEVSPNPRMSVQATSSPAPAVPVNSDKPSTSAGSDVGRRDSLTVVDPFAVGPLDVATSHFVSDEAIQAELAKKQRSRGVTFGDAGRDPPTTNSPATLVLMRHGESMWNDLKLFTGDVDIPLTEKGVLEAMEGGRAVATIDFDMIFTSRLIRSKQTALLAMTQSKHKRVPVIVRGGFMGKGKTGDENRLRLREAAWHALQKAECRMIPVYADPALNERCYGHLQGLNKEEAAKEFGKEVVDRWRRSHNTSPPGGESLLDTWERCVSFFEGTIEPRLQEGNNVLVVAHGNVLRCIISYLAGLSTLEMLRLQIVTALPYAYAYDGERFAACCVLPPVDPVTNKPRKGLPQGLASVLKREEIDSLI